MGQINSETSPCAADYVAFRLVGRWSEPQALRFVFERRDGQSDTFNAVQLRRWDWWQQLSVPTASAIASALREPVMPV